MPRNRTKKRGVKVELLGNMTLRLKKEKFNKENCNPLLLLYRTDNIIEFP